MRGYEEVMYWVELAIDSMVSLAYRLNRKYGGDMLMDRYNWYLLGAVKDKVTTEEDIAMEREVHKVVDECREEGLIASLYCEEDRPHYVKF